MLEKYEFSLLVFSLLVNCNETRPWRLILQCLPYKSMYLTFSCMDEKKECSDFRGVVGRKETLGSCTILEVDLEA